MNLPLYWFLHAFRTRVLWHPICLASVANSVMAMFPPSAAPYVEVRAPLSSTLVV